jgi:hypothetical protein
MMLKLYLVPTLELIVTFIRSGPASSLPTAMGRSTTILILRHAEIQQAMIYRQPAGAGVI